MRPIAIVLSAMSLIAASPAVSADWSPRPWLDDLAQMKGAFATQYANIEWLEHDRSIALDALFARASDRLRAARSDADARAVFTRLIDRVGDGHVAIDWPRRTSSLDRDLTPPAKPYDACDDLGFDSSRSNAGIAASLPDYHAVGASDPFPSGIIRVGGRSVGVVRIGGFEPQGSPSICRAALVALKRTPERPCYDRCRDAILTRSYVRLTNVLEERLRDLKAAGAQALLVDVTDNGGGTEWVEAAARIVSPKPLTSERRGFVRGPHWATQWKTLSDGLRAAASADTPDRTRLLAWAAEADRARGDAGRACSTTEACDIVGRAGYATGLVGAARAGAFSGKPWADLVFTATQFPYHDSVWSGPVVVLVDDETWSAAEEFAAILQDNHAAVILGTRTGGAGCGHTNGGTPTVLTNSGATLELPDCVRFRADGSNEVAGVIPDVLTGMKANDGVAFKSRLIEAHLVQALALADREWRR